MKWYHLSIALVISIMGFVVGIDVGEWLSEKADIILLDDWIFCTIICPVLGAIVSGLGYLTIISFSITEKSDLKQRFTEIIKKS